MRCFFKKEGFLNEADVPQGEYIINSLSEVVNVPKEKLVQIFKKCAQFEGEDPCENAYHLLECYTTDKDIKAAS